MKTIQSIPIQITDEDKRRLDEVLDELKRNPANRDDLTLLATELDRAITVQPRKIPRNIVTMNSRVAIIDIDTNERLTFTLVYPEETKPEKNRISVLSPIGSGMLGHRVGDEFECPAPDGMRRFQIAKIVYQPEAWKHSRRYCARKRWYLKRAVA